MLRSLLAVALATVVGVHAQNYPVNAYSGTTLDSNDNLLPLYSPARPPAVPLAVRAPYTSAWSSTANNGTLYEPNAR